MCGITGWVGFRRDVREQHATALGMTTTMACRGPDAEGVWTDTHVALGHRRLSIIDLAGSTQPMAEETPEGCVVLVYSGEIYNFTELREQLRLRGHRFRTSGDTEVVLRGYLEWGDGLPDRLNGMYAFAIWDGRSERLSLVRDRLGIKPLYYYPTEDGLLFGSEPKAILANPLARREVGLDGLREMFSLVRTPGQAVWSGMQQVLPGSVVVLDRAGLRTSTYWELTLEEHRDGPEETVARVRELLDDIVERQLIADVPRCVLLSGGLDSSALAVLATERLRGKEVPRTFSVDFAGSDEGFRPDELRTTPDAPYVRDVAEHAGTEHRDLVLAAKDLADPALRSDAVLARDMAVAMGDLDKSLLLLFRAVREHSTVALSGEAADEVFGGYSWFHAPALRDVDNFPWEAAARRYGGYECSGLLDPALLDLLDVPGYTESRYREALAQVPYGDETDRLERRMREICHMHLTRLLTYMLERKDRISMATGLEVRVPFCDHRLVTYVFNAPWSVKTFDGREKSLLRHATADLLPRSVVERVKSPYPSTQEPAYTAALQNQLKDLLSSGSPALDLLDRAALTEGASMDPSHMAAWQRHQMDKALDFAVWLELQQPVLKFA